MLTVIDGTDEADTGQSFSRNLYYSSCFQPRQGDYRHACLPGSEGGHAERGVGADNRITQLILCLAGKKGDHLISRSFKSTNYLFESSI
jgi:hypothetical protein